MFTINDVVTTSKTAENGHLKLVSAFQLMQDCSELWVESEPILKQYLKENDLTQLLLSRQVEIIRVPKYKEKLTITTRVFEFRGFYGFRNTVISDENGTPCYVTWSTGVVVNNRSGRLSKIENSISEKMTYDDKVEMEYTNRKIVVPTEHKTLLADYGVSKDDIDYNKHMNNAQYIRMACEHLPENFGYNRIRVEYKKPAKYSDRIYIKKANIDGKLYMMLDGESDNYATIEFSHR